MRVVKYSLLLLLAFVFIVFCVVNRASVTVDLFPVPYSFEAPIFILMLASMMLGVIITGFFMNLKHLKNYTQHRQTKKRMQAVENENKTLRSEREASFISLPKQS